MTMMTPPLPTENQCPRCGHGRLQPLSKPYWHVFRGQVFTIPDALYHECDACGYGEYDDVIVDLLGMMLYHAFRRNEPPREDDSGANSRDESTSVPPARP